MSETDSFIDEVSEEVRRDRLFVIFRKYGWIAISLVVLVVGGAAYNEYAKSQAQSQAQDLGNAIYAALELDGQARIDALQSAMSDAQDAQAVLAMLQAEQMIVAGDTDGAVKILTETSQNTNISTAYQNLTGLKAEMLRPTSAQERVDALKPYAVPGSAFRTIALEEIALAQLDARMTEDAIATLRELALEPEATQGQRSRASDLLVTLGTSVSPEGA